MGDREIKYRLPSVSSVDSAELIAIYKALKFILSELGSIVIILINSLQSLEVINPVHSLVRRFRLLLVAIDSRSILVEFFWVPNPVGVRGNQLGDREAKAASSKLHIDAHITFDKDVNKPACFR